MNIMEIIVWLIIAVLLGGILLTAFYNEDIGLGPKARKAFKSFLGESLPEEEIVEAGTPVELPAEQKESLATLKAALENMITSSKSQCFLRYTPFSDLGMTTFEFTYDPLEDKTAVIVRQGRQFIPSDFFSIEGMKPCVIAGEQVVDNFERGFVDSIPLAPNHFFPVNSLTISYSEDRFNGNILRAGGLPEGVVNDESNNFQNNGLLYTPDNRHICFFPTVYGASDADGLNDDFFDPTLSTSFVSRLGQDDESLHRGLTQC